MYRLHLRSRIRLWEQRQPDLAVIITDKRSNIELSSELSVWIQLAFIDVDGGYAVRSNQPATRVRVSGGMACGQFVIPPLATQHLGCRAHKSTNSPPNPGLSGYSALLLPLNFVAIFVALIVCVMIIDRETYACESCVRGHRTSNCNHYGEYICAIDLLSLRRQDLGLLADENNRKTERPLQPITKKGRPVSQCLHCRSMRKSRSAHVKCGCGKRTSVSERQDESVEDNQGEFVLDN